MMQYTAVDSSMIDLIGYDEDTEILEVRFVNTGYTYEYEGVPKEEYEALLNLHQKGVIWVRLWSVMMDFVKKQKQ